jgi:hypothetical protein
MSAQTNAKPDTAKSIRIQSIISILAIALIGPFGVLLWALLMTQYSKRFRILYIIIFGLIPTILLGILAWVTFLAAVGDEKSGDILDGIWSPLLYSAYGLIVLPLVPMIYSLIWPLGRNK